MKTFRLLPALGLALVCVFLCPSPLRSQMPQRPGRLIVTSTPPGATVTIDQQQMSRLTPSAFALGSGQHSVSVRGKDAAGKDMYCAVTLSVPAGTAKTIHCTPRGWDPPVK